ncbi:MAG TPA: hypothetical protein VL691_22410 [Vicinamibacteria bacterium]|nr:hypothetical protein [Vicinamibacteria bacterium]
MTTTDRPSRLRNRGRSLGAVFAGFVAVVVLSVGTDAALHATGVFPPWGQAMSDALFLLSTAYRTAYGVVASYVTARLAPARPMAHALAGGVLGLAVATAGAVATWNAGPQFGPHWYPLALIATVLPCAWAGATLYLRQLRPR